MFTSWGSRLTGRCKLDADGPPLTVRVMVYAAAGLIVLAVVIITL